MVGNIDFKQNINCKALNIAQLYW